MASPSDADVAQSTRARVLLWLGIAFLALGAWLAWPRVRADASGRPLEIVLVDVSKSAVASDGSQWSTSTRARLTAIGKRAVLRGDDVTLIAFGRDVRTVIANANGTQFLERVLSASFDPSRELLEPDARDGARESRLADALALAATQGSVRAHAHVTILGDGTYTGRDAAAAAESLARAGVGVELESAPVRAWNLALGPLQVPRAIEEGAPLVVSADVRLDIDSLPPPAIQVEFTRRDARGQDTSTVAVAAPNTLVPVGTRASTVRVHADLGPAVPGPIELEARVVLLDEHGARTPDATPEDDASAAIVRCAGSLVVGVVDAAQSGKPLYDLLRGADTGLDLRAIAAHELAASLAIVDAVATVDAPLDEDEERLLVSFVAHGGGWLDVSGWNWIPKRAANREALASIAALEPSKNALTPRDVVFLVDASGSMSGEPFEAIRRALVPLVDAALPQDDVAVRFFAADVSPPILFGTGAERADRARVSALVERVRTERDPGGATRLWLALRTLLSERAESARGAENRPALVLLLSDGQDPDRTDALERAARLRTELAAARVRLVAISPTEGADVDFLRSLTDTVVSMPGSGADGQPNWAFVFKRELARDAVRQRSNQQVFPVLGGSDLAAQLASACGHVPPIDVAVRCDARTGASNVWTGDDGAPLGAIARAGTGLVATLAFAPNTQWAPGWTDPKSLAPIVRALARGHAERASTPSLRVEGQRFVLEGVDANFPAQTIASVRTASGARIALEFVAGAPGYDPIATRTALVPSELGSTADGLAFVRFESTGALPLELAAPFPRAPEFAFDVKRFVPPAEAGGQIAHTEPEARAHWLAPYALLAGVLLLASAVFASAFSRLRARAP